MDQFTEPYYLALKQFDFAKSTRNFKGALNELRIGLRHTPAALTSMFDQNGWLPPSIPFIGDGAGALAAIFNDEEAFELMDVVNKMPIIPHAVDVGRYRRDADVVQAVRDHLASVESCTLIELRALFAAEDAERLTVLTNWMVKVGEISKERAGNATVVSGRVEQQIAEEQLPPFRKGMESCAVPILRFLQHPAGKDTLGNFDEKQALYPDGVPIVADTDVRELRLPAPDRQPSMTTTRSTRDGAWLIARSKQQPNGSWKTHVGRCLPDGTKIQPLVLRHPIKHSFSEPSRQEIVTIDRALHVRVYGFDGALLAGMSLAESPEIAEFYEQTVGTEDSVRLKAIDVSAEHDLIAFGYADCCWIFKLDGTPVASFRVPAMPSNSTILMGDSPSIDLPTALVSQGLSSDSSPREIAEWLDSEGIMPRSMHPSMSFSVTVNLGEDEDPDEDDFEDIGSVNELDVIAREVNGLRVDWIYYLRLDPDGKSVWVSTHSGLLARVSMDGNVMDSWLYPSNLQRLWSVEGRTFAEILGCVAEVIPGIAKPPFWRGSGYDTNITGRVVTNRLERGLHLCDVLTGERKSITLARDFRAVYLTATGIRVETSTTYADIST